MSTSIFAAQLAFGARLAELHGRSGRWPWRNGWGRPLLLDLFCGAGGAMMGYHRAGFEVVGVDIKRQPHYPSEFVWNDALDFLWQHPIADLFDAIHASCPCQKFTGFRYSQPQRQNQYIDLIGPTREALKEIGLPWVMENVPGSPLIDPVTVCGSAFGLEIERGQLTRHRWFEANFPIRGTTCRHDGRPTVMVCGHGKDGYRGSGLTASEAREAMRIDWMNRDEMAQAIPPTYTDRPAVDTAP